MKENYKIIRNLVSKEKCAAMARRLEDLLQREIYRSPDTQCKLSPAFYSVLNDEMLEVWPTLEKIIETDLWPVYTYARIYQTGDYLLPHFDRPGAEISFTMTLDYDKYIWPFWLQESDGSLKSVELDVGDALVYKGSEVSHFRHPMTDQDFQHQAFFHFVSKNGPFSHLKFDEREQLLTNKEAEVWNFPDWSDEKFRNDPNFIINRITNARKDT